jgi:hypothetical protein
MQETEGQMRQKAAMLELCEGKNRVHLSWTWTRATKESEAT